MPGKGDITIRNIVIVESPAKAKTIENFLGKDFMVASSMGHIRDLVKKNYGIEIEQNYRPIYEVSPEKRKVVNELKKLAATAEQIWLATDEDREGEAIAWHLAEVLKLDPTRTRRIVFNEITKDAIQNAIQTPRTVDLHLVDAQQARRILDRLVGFELSPILWRKVRPQLSAGRVQSVAVRLLVEREREIMAFETSSAFKVTAYFQIPDPDGGKKNLQLKAELSKRFETRREVLDFLEKCRNAHFTVADIVTKPSKKSPAPPFTTSTLQQEASRKLSFPVGLTMSVAQRLYEAGKITYMRTDSTHLSDLALNSAEKAIANSFGPQYCKRRQYKTKAKGAQEAHEAIRPTYMDHETIQGSNQERRLYELIWKRAIASQMADALLEKTTVSIDISGMKEKFVARGEILKFDGFLKVYIESTDMEAAEREDEEDSGSLLPPVNKGDLLKRRRIDAVERFSQRPPRYTEASLVKKLEELGIGRPSTYAPTISTIQQRGYVIKEDREGVPRPYLVITLDAAHISEESRTETTGAEKAKLFPTDIGMVVTDFLNRHFQDIMDYNFTACVEKEFDEIAEGKLVWYKMIDGFYKPFHRKVVETTETSERSIGARLLGSDPNSGKPVYVRIGRFGPIAQIGESDAADATPTNKPLYASLRKDQRLETVTLEEALKLFELPRNLGQFENNDVIASVGRFGPYILHDKKYYSIKSAADDPHTIELERAINLVREKREADLKRIIRGFPENPELRVLNGRFGPYIAYNKNNYKIPKNTDPLSLSLDDCMKLITEMDKKKTLKSFPDNPDIRILNGAFGAKFISFNGSSYKLPRKINVEDVTLAYCQKVIAAAEKKKNPKAAATAKLAKSAKPAKSSASSKSSKPAKSAKTSRKTKAAGAAKKPKTSGNSRSSKPEKP